MRRCAVLRPIPGSRASSVINASMALTVSRRRTAAGDLPHFRLQEVGRAPLRLGDRGRHQIAQKLGVVPREDGRIDHHRAHGAPAIGRDPDHAAARGGLDGTAGELGLELLQPALHLLAELKELLKVRHAIG